MTYFTGLADGAADGSWGVTFPDLPGCTSAGIGMDDLVAKSMEALRLWAADAIADGETLPTPRGLAALLDDPAVRATMAAVGPVFFVEVPLLLDAGRSVKATISMDAGLLAAIDEAAARTKLTRSSYLASAAREKIERGS